METEQIQQQTNGDLIGDTAPVNGQRQPLPSELLGANLALLVGAIARTLPEELSPQSRYQVAVDLAKTVVGSQLAQALTP